MALIAFLSAPVLPIIWFVVASAGLLIAAGGAAAWFASARSVKVTLDCPQDALCFTRARFGEIEVHGRDSAGEWIYRLFPVDSTAFAKIQRRFPAAAARFERRYPSLHEEDARLLARMESGALKAFTDLERNGGAALCDLNRDAFHQTIDSAALALFRLRQSKESAMRSRSAGAADLAAEPEDTEAVEKARTLADRIGDLRARLARTGLGDEVDRAGLLL